MQAELPRLGARDISTLGLAELFVPFESLGNNCEFGIVQRHNGYDPPGLFRNVGFLDPDAMIKALQNGFAGLFEPNSYRFSHPEGWPDWQLTCNIYGFGFHTAIPAELDLHGESGRVRAVKCIQSFHFLKRRMREDLQSGEKIFVFRHNLDSSDTTIESLHAALCVHGDNWLLYVVEDPIHETGWVEYRKPGLIVAGISHLSNENPPVVDFLAWERIARRSLALRWCPETARAQPLWEKTVIQTGLRPSPPLPHLEVIEHAVLEQNQTDKPVSHILIEGLDPDRLYEFDLFIYIPAEFAGTAISIVNWGSPSIAFNAVSLGSRGSWQRLFVRSYPTKGEGRLVPSLVAAAAAKTVFYSSGWKIRVVAESKPAPQRQARELLGYAYNNGGLNNQKYALAGLVTAAFATRRAMFLPDMFNLDHHDGSLCGPCAFGAIFDRGRFEGFLRAYGIRLVERPPGFDTEDPHGWAFFKGDAAFKTPAGFDIAFAKNLLPCLTQNDLFTWVVAEVFQKRSTKLAVQLRVENDWVAHAENELKPSLGGDEDYHIPYRGIFQKLAKTLPGCSRHIYVACDEAGLPAPKEDIRADIKAAFGFELIWKSDFVDGRADRRLSSLELSVLDFEIAMRAEHFVGLSRSAFSNRVGWEKFCRTGVAVTTHYIYNAPGDRLARRTDHGAFADPQRATRAHAE